MKEKEKEYRDLIKDMYACLKSDTTMVKFRELGFLRRPLDEGEGFSDHLRALRHERLMRKTPQESMQSLRHIETEREALLEVTMAFGWSDPFNQVGTEGKLNQSKLDAALANLVRLKKGRDTAAYKCKKHGGDHTGVRCCPDTVQSAASYLASEWFLWPESCTKKKSGAENRKKRREAEMNEAEDAGTEDAEAEDDDIKYKLTVKSGHWTNGLGVEPTPAAHERYSKFIDAIKGKYDEEDA